MKSGKLGFTLMPAVLITSSVLVTGSVFVQPDNMIDPLAGTEQPSKVTLTTTEIKKLCIATENKSGLILDEQELCEVSIDDGKTWTPLEKALLIGGGLLGLGALTKKGMILRNRKKISNHGGIDLTKKIHGLKDSPIKVISRATVPAQTLEVIQTVEFILTPPEEVASDETTHKTQVLSHKPFQTRVPEHQEEELKGPSNLEIIMQQKLLEDKLKEIDGEYEKAPIVLTNICEQLQGFIDELSSRGAQYSSMINNYHFFGRSVRILAKKIPSEKSYTYSFELTLHGANGIIYASKQAFTDLEVFRTFFHEKIEEEYAFLSMKAKERLDPGTFKKLI